MNKRFSVRPSFKGVRSRASVRGWTLVEMSVVLALLGFLLMGGLHLLQQGAAVEGAVQSARHAAAAGDALLGHSYVHWRLPAPTDGAPDESSPGYESGYLPLFELGLDVPVGGAYTVATSLTQAAASPRWKADPYGWLGSLLPQRENANGLDLCLTLMQRDVGLPDGRVLAYGVQFDSQATVGADPPAWVLPPLSAASAAGHEAAQLVSRLTDVRQLAADMGCVDRLALLASRVKQASVAADAMRVAAQQRRNLVLEQGYNDQEGINHTWRGAVHTANATLTVARFLLLLAEQVAGDVASSPGEVAKVALNIVQNALHLAASLDLAINSFQFAAGNAEKAVVLARQLASLDRMVQQMDASLYSTIGQVVSLQTRGIFP